MIVPRIVSLFCLIVFTFLNQQIDSFVLRSYDSSPTNHRHSRIYIGNIFGTLFGQSDEPTNNDDDKNRNGVKKPLIDLPATRVKIGPMKFFLQLYLVAEQNKPVKGSWVLNNNEENSSLDVYYRDGSGMFSIGLDEDKIRIDRYGSQPSLQYVLQESVMIHGILDELNRIAYEIEDIEEEKRLIQFADNMVIANARRVLPARKAS